MFNIRYHIASLVAVFLALALGLVLGGLVVQRGSFDRQQDALVEGLRNEFASLRTENRELTVERDLLSTYAAEMGDRWIANRLKNKTIVILNNAGRDEGLRAAREAVEAAGGEVVLVTMARPEFGVDDDAVRASLGAETIDPEALRESIVASLAAEWAADGLEERPMTDALLAAGAIVGMDLPAGQRISGIVDIAAPDGVSDAAAVELSSRLQSVGVAAVGAQVPGSTTGKAAAAAGADYSAIDTLGTVVGRYSLVAVMAGAETGYYGLASAAQAPYPRPWDDSPIVPQVQ